MLDLTTIPFVYSPNYKKGMGKVNYIVLHCPVGSYQSAINTFKNSANQVSAHYVVSQKGEITQMVQLENVAWHCYGFNSESIGIEMEDKGLVEKSAGWITPDLMEATAKLVAALLKKYELGLDAIIGHNAPFVQAYAKQHRPSMCHVDPGPYFNFNLFKSKVQQELNNG